MYVPRGLLRIRPIVLKILANGKEDPPSEERPTNASRYVALHTRDLFGVDPTSRKFVVCVLEKDVTGDRERVLQKECVVTRYIMGKSGASLRRSKENGRRRSEESSNVSKETSLFPEKINI